MRGLVEIPHGAILHCNNDWEPHHSIATSGQRSFSGKEVFAGVVVHELERNMADHLQPALFRTNQRTGQTFDSSSLANSSGARALFQHSLSSKNTRPRG